MLAFKTAYRDAGFAPTDDELPDYLPMVLDFAALCPRGQRLLHAHRADLELLRRALDEAESPYADVVAPSAPSCPRLGRRELGQVAHRLGAGPPREDVGLEPFAPPEYLGTADGGPMTRTRRARAAEHVLVGRPALPALAIFVVGHIWRWRYDQFGWTSRSTQLQERRLLKWGAPLFHYGTFAAIGGHVLGILIPEQLDEAIGIPENVYRWFSATAGTLAAVLVIGGVVVLATRRLFVPRVRATTAPVDYVALILLLVIILTGIAPTVVNLFGRGYDYRTTVAPWFRGLFTGHPRRERDRARAVDLPGARDGGVADLGGVAVQPARARLELPAVVPVAARTSSTAAAAPAAGRTRHRRTQVAQDRCPVLRALGVAGPGRRPHAATRATSRW